MQEDNRSGFHIKSAEEFVRLRTSEEPEEYRLAATGWASDEVWAEVIDRFPDMREWVAHNKTVPLHILERLSTDSNSSVRSTVAMKRKRSPHLFEVLSRDRSDSVRSSIANNPKLPPDVAATLVRDRWAHVRRALASNPATPLPLVRQLAEDKDSDVREAAERALKNCT